MTPSPVVRLADVRRRRRPRRAAPFAKRAAIASAIGISLLGGIVLIGVAATALTPRTPLALLASLALAAAAGWPLSAMLMARVKRSGKAALSLPRFLRARREPQPAPARPRRTGSRVQSRFTPNPLHPSAREWGQQHPTRRP